MQARLSAAVRDNEVASLRLGSRLGALEAALEGGRLREGSLEREAGALREDLERARGTAAELQVGRLGGGRDHGVLRLGRETPKTQGASAQPVRLQLTMQVPASGSARASVRLGLQ